MAIKLQYPANWKVTEENDTIKFRPSSTFIPYFGISVKSLPLQIKSLSDLNKDITTGISSYATITQSSPTIFAGNLANKVEFTFTKGDYVEKWMQLWTVKNDREYIVSYVGEPLEYSKYLPIVQRMINTISLGTITTTVTSNMTAETDNKVIIPGIL